MPSSEGILILLAHTLFVNVEVDMGESLHYSAISGESFGQKLPPLYETIIREYPSGQIFKASSLYKLYN